MNDKTKNQKHMRLSKKPDAPIRHAKCPNVHCKKWDKYSESNCFLPLDQAMKCIYNEESQYERK